MSHPLNLFDARNWPDAAAIARDTALSRRILWRNGRARQRSVDIEMAVDHILDFYFKLYTIASWLI
jgi:hypothetical protein